MNAPLSPEEIERRKQLIREGEAVAKTPGPIAPQPRGEPIEHGDVLSDRFGAVENPTVFGEDPEHVPEVVAPQQSIEEMARAELERVLAEQRAAEEEPTIIDAADPIVDAVPTPPNPLDSASPELVNKLTDLGREYGPLGVAMIAAYLSSPETVAAQLGAAAEPGLNPRIPDGTTMLFVGPPPQFPTPFSSAMNKIAEAMNQQTGQMDDIWFFNLATPNAGIHLQIPASSLVGLAEDILRTVRGAPPPTLPPGITPMPMNRQQRRHPQRGRG